MGAMVAAEFGNLRYLEPHLQGGTVALKGLLLEAACGAGQEGVASLLLNNLGPTSGASSSCESALIAAAQHGHLSIVTLLLDRGVDASAQDSKRNGFTALMAASKNGHLDVMRLLLDRGANPNSVDMIGRHAIFHLPLHNAPRAAEVVRLLAERGALLDLKDTKYGSTPLGALSFSAPQSVVAEVCAMRANVNAPCGPEGFFPLHPAARRGNVGVGITLLEHGAHVDGQTMAGLTPLMTACQFGCVDFVRLLLAHRANVNLQDSTGATPLDHAICNKSDEVVRLLQEEYGARGKGE